MNHDTYFRGPSNHHDGIHTIRDSRHAYGNRYQAQHDESIWTIVGAILAAFAVTFILCLILLYSGVARAQSTYDTSSDNLQRTLMEGQILQQQMQMQYDAYRQRQYQQQQLFTQQQQLEQQRQQTYQLQLLNSDRRN